MMWCQNQGYIECRLSRSLRKKLGFKLIPYLAITVDFRNDSDSESSSSSSSEKADDHIVEYLDRMDNTPMLLVIGNKKLIKRTKQEMNGTMVTILTEKSDDRQSIIFVDENGQRQFKQNDINLRKDGRIADMFGELRHIVNSQCERLGLYASYGNLPMGGRCDSILQARKQLDQRADAILVGAYQTARLADPTLNLQQPISMTQPNQMGMQSSLQQPGNAPQQQLNEAQLKMLQANLEAQLFTTDNMARLGFFQLTDSQGRVLHGMNDLKSAITSPLTLSCGAVKMTVTITDPSSQSNATSSVSSLLQSQSQTSEPSSLKSLTSMFAAQSSSSL
jgi:hypothetical protein